MALAVSTDLLTWTRLGLVRYATEGCLYDLNQCGSKDAVIFPGVVQDPRGRPALAILHRPTYAVTYYCDCFETILPPGGRDHPENIWISYVPLERARADPRELAHVEGHRVLLAPRADWESLKVGAGAPPVRLPYGWLLLYHGVAPVAGSNPPAVRYSAGAAVLDLEQPATVLYRTPRPILTPETPPEQAGVVPHVVFPTATDRRAGHRLDL